jgi:DNA invertase Pin-like site-specific DNA recombinase
MGNKITIIYLRTSTEEQNPENQLRDCKTLVKDQYEIVREQQSAFKDKDRPLFEKIKERIKRKEIGELICWDLDRLFRNRMKLLGFFEFCKTYDCNILSFRQGFLNEMQNIQLPEGFEWVKEMQVNNFLQMLGWIAEDESKKKSERVKIAFKNSTKKWGRKPLKNMDKRIKELHEIGKSVRDIAREVHYWDANKNKKFVSKSYVHKIIQRFEWEKS